MGPSGADGASLRRVAAQMWRESRRRCGASRGADVGRFEMRQRSHCADVSPYVNGSSDFLKQMSELHSNTSNISEATLSLVETARW